MKTFPVKFSYKENENDHRLETIRAELEFWARIQELEEIVKQQEQTINSLTSAVQDYLQLH